MPEKYMELLKVVSESYDHFEKDRNMLERSIELSSNEMIGLYNQLRTETGELKLAHQELNRIFNNINEVLYSVDMISFRVTHISAMCEKVYGYKPEEFYADAYLWQNVILPEDKHIAAQHVQDLFNGKQVYNRYRIQRKDGSIRTIENQITPTLDSNKRLIRLDGVTNDVTEKIARERKLQESEANLRNLLENTDAAYVLLDLNYRVLSFNNNAFEFSKKQLCGPLDEGLNYIELIPLDRREEVRENIRLVLESGLSIRYQVNYAYSGSENIWMSISMHPITNADRQVIGLSISARDITMQKTHEEQIRLSNERYDLVTKATNDVIWDWDLTCDKIYRSENYRQVFGYSTENNVYTNSWLDHIHPEDKARVCEGLDKKINSPGAILWEDEYRYFRSNGELAYVNDRGYILQNEQGKPIRIVGAMRDVTSEKLYALEREKLTYDLMQHNKDLEQFAYIVSHNLRAPVANITGISTIMQLQKHDKTVVEQCVVNLVKAVNKLDEVTLDLNAILQTRREIQEKKEPVHFSQMVNSIEESISNLIKSEQVTIRTNFSESDELFTIKSYFHSILYNLISNSIKYRKPDEPPVIEISSRKNCNRLWLQFKDNGLGIDLATQGKKVFGLYKRFHPDIEGKGMGLFMVKTQVETLGGKISINSEVNKGTEFTIEFEL